MKYNGKKLAKGTDYTVRYSNNKAIGTATVTITGKGRCAESVKKTFRIKDVTKLGDEHEFTVFALVRPIVSTVAIQMPKPEAGAAALPDASKVKAHLTYANPDLFKGRPVCVPTSIDWSPKVGEGQTVAFGTEYVADLTFTKAEPDVEFSFADDLDVYHTTSDALVREVGTYIDAGYDFDEERFEARVYFEHSDMAKLFHVSDPDWVQGVAYTDDVEAIKSLLPAHVDIVCSDPTIEYAAVEWLTPELIEDGREDTDDADEEADVIYQSVWQVAGTVRPFSSKKVLL